MIKLLLSKIYKLYLKFKVKEWDKGGLIVFPIHVSGGEFIKIGKSFRCKRRTRIEAIKASKYNSNNKFIIEIGNNVFINWDCHIGAINKIIIKENVLIGSKVLITDHSHGSLTLEEINDIPINRDLYSKGPVLIEKNVWIGEGAAILPNVTIGENSIIGANSVVTHDIPANCVAAGNPARVIRYLKDERNKKS